MQELQLPIIMKSQYNIRHGTTDSCSHRQSVTRVPHAVLLREEPPSEHGRTLRPAGRLSRPTGRPAANRRRPFPTPGRSSAGDGRPPPARRAATDPAGFPVAEAGPRESKENRTGWLVSKRTLPYAARRVRPEAGTRPARPPRPRRVPTDRRRAAPTAAAPVKGRAAHPRTKGTGPPTGTRHRPCGPKLSLRRTRHPRRQRRGLPTKRPRKCGAEPPTSGNAEKQPGAPPVPEAEAVAAAGPHPRTGRRGSVGRGLGWRVMPSTESRRNRRTDNRRLRPPPDMAH